MYSKVTKVIHYNLKEIWMRRLVFSRKSQKPKGRSKVEAKVPFLRTDFNLLY